MYPREEGPGSGPAHILLMPHGPVAAPSACLAPRTPRVSSQACVLSRRLFLLLLRAPPSLILKRPLQDPYPHRLPRHPPLTVSPLRGCETQEGLMV